MRWTLFQVAAVAIFASGLVGAANARPPVIAEGRTLAIHACSACHQVTETQSPSSPVFNPDTLEHVAAPSFVEIARKYGKNTAALRAFIRTPAHPMREQQFLPHDLDLIVVYIKSLEPRH
jgi:mono/diheme cytochrome c family protein